MIDQEQFTDTFQYFDKEMVVEIIDMFLQECPQRISMLRKNILEKDFDQIAFNAHSLKGVVASFFDPEATGLAKTLEMMGKDRTGEGLNEIMEKLEASLVSVVAELTEKRKEMSS